MSAKDKKSGAVDHDRYIEYPEVIVLLENEADPSSSDAKDNEPVSDKKSSGFPTNSTFLARIIFLFLFFFGLFMSTYQMIMFLKEAFVAVYHQNFNDSNTRLLISSQKLIADLCYLGIFFIGFLVPAWGKRLLKKL